MVVSPPTGQKEEDEGRRLPRASAWFHLKMSWGPFCGSVLLPLLFLPRSGCAKELPCPPPHRTAPCFRGVSAVTTGGTGRFPSEYVDDDAREYEGL